MKKIKIKVSFRYDGEAVIDVDDEREILKDGEGVKLDFLDGLNYYLNTFEERANGAIFDWDFEEKATGVISDWKFEAKEVEA